MMKTIYKNLFGLLQLLFGVQLAISFILFITILIHKGDLASRDTKNKEKRFLLVTQIACCSLGLTTFLIIWLIVHRSLTVDYVGSFRVLQVGASFKVAMLSWIINVFAGILNVIGIIHCRGESGPAPWELTLVFYSLFTIQQAYQIKCLYKLEVRALIIREGPDWHRFRRAMFVLMALFNALLWLMSLSNMNSISDLRKECMDGLLTKSVFRIVHTVGRAAMLAYRIESTLLFFKFFREDKESLTGLARSDLVLTPTAISHTEIGNGRWFSGFLAIFYIALAIASFIWNSHEKQFQLATVACFLTSLTIVVVCIRLQCSGPSNRYPPGPSEENVPDSKGILENVSVYISGRKFNNTKLLLFYSVAAVTYHIVLALHLTTETPSKESYYRISRESWKSVGCIFLGLFGMWMSHAKRRIRTWRPLHVMIAMIATMFFLDIAEECASYGNDEYEWVIYIFPLAIDFKMYMLIHTWSDLMASKNEYLVECENLLRFNNVHTSVRSIGSPTTNVQANNYGTISNV